MSSSRQQLLSRESAKRERDDDDDDDDDDFAQVYSINYVRGSSADERKSNPDSSASLNDKSETTEKNREGMDERAARFQVPTDFGGKYSKALEAKARAAEKHWKRRNEADLTCKNCGEMGHPTQGCPSSLGATHESSLSPPLETIEIPILDVRLRARIIGPSGSVVQQMQRDSRCKIRVEDAIPPREGFVVKISGFSRKSLKRAERLLSELVESLGSRLEARGEWKRARGEENNGAPGAASSGGFNSQSSPSPSSSLSGAPPPASLPQSHQVATRSPSSASALTFRRAPSPPKQPEHQWTPPDQSNHNFQSFNAPPLPKNISRNSLEGPPSAHHLPRQINARESLQNAYSVPILAENTPTPQHPSSTLSCVSSSLLSLQSSYVPPHSAPFLPPSPHFTLEDDSALQQDMERLQREREREEERERERHEQTMREIAETYGKRVSELRVSYEGGSQKITQTTPPPSRDIPPAFEPPAGAYFYPSQRQYSQGEYVNSYQTVEADFKASEDAAGARRGSWGYYNG